MVAEISLTNDSHEKEIEKKLTRRRRATWNKKLSRVPLTHRSNDLKTSNKWKKNCIHAQASMAIFFVLRAQFFFILGSVKSENELERIRKRTFLCWRRNLFACCRVSCSAVCFRFCVKWERRSETCGCSVRSTCWQPPQLISSCITFTRHDKKKREKTFFQYTILRCTTSVCERPSEKHRAGRRKMILGSLLFRLGR